jgi:hypothetical protein
MEVCQRLIPNCSRSCACSKRPFGDVEVLEIIDETPAATRQRRKAGCSTKKATTMIRAG